MFSTDCSVCFKLLALWYSTCARVRLEGLCILSFNCKSNEYIKFTIYIFWKKGNEDEEIVEVSGRYTVSKDLHFTLNF